MGVPFVIACLIIPLLVEFLTKRFKIFHKIGAIMICYALGLGFAQVLNHGAELANLQETLSGVAVFLAIPLLLMAINTSNLKLISPKMALSALLALFALIVVVGSGHLLFGSSIPEASKVGGMMIGIYTGGTPNLASIKTALDVSSETYISIHTFDTLLGAIYILILLAFSGVWRGKRTEKKEQFVPEKSFLKSFKWIRKDTVKITGIEIVVAILITAVSVGISMWLDAKINMTIVILLLTSLSIFAGIVASKRKYKTNDGAGYYFLNVFSFTVASMANVNNLITNGTDLLSYVAFVLFTSFFLHIILCRLFKIERSIIMVTSVALVCSPPFVPIITKSYNRSDLMVPGLMIGILGYIVGNYLGVLFDHLLH